MSPRHVYRTTIRNEYLGEAKEITGSSPSDVEYKAREQLRRWEEKEAKQREQDRINALRCSADRLSHEAIEELEAWKSILAGTLRVDDRLLWEALKDKTQFSANYPTLEEISAQIGVPKQNKLVEAVMRSKKEERLRKEAEAKNKLAERLAAIEKERLEFEAKQKEHNASIDQLKADFEAGKPEAVEKYLALVLERSKYPKGFEKSFQVQYDPAARIVVIAFELPSKDQVPSVVEHRFVPSKKAIVPVPMKPKEFDAFYEDCLYQICLRTLHEVFESVYTTAVQSVVFNGWVKGIDSKTGKSFHSCIISCQASREEFESLNLERVSPKECFKHLKGISAGPLAQLSPVRPILELNREDARFIESREVLAGVSASSNLATMDWEDFEHLVRELFAKEFSCEGGEVRITQASRDAGVDAVAFDPDPIRGGKFVIQAKRYNNVVPFSAVRDLYGTVIAEGAVKGILVTTSDYGNDSMEFAKGKPLTLLNGSHLVYMLQKHGHKVHIELQK